MAETLVVNNTLETAVYKMLEELGENPDREGLVKTPSRVAKAMQYLTSGYMLNVNDLLNGAIFEEEYNEMVIVRDIDVFSLCEHHLLPFYGRAHVAYIPKGRIVGLSKLPRVVDMYAKRLQVQERLTQQIAQTLYDVLQPAGVAVVIEARHMCMMMRGVEKQNSLATTSAMLGVFQKDQKTRAEFLNLIDRKIPGM